MLKKLVKYGNSSALVFDKPILELLGIAEGSLLKIKTDGTSLIITPHENTMTPKETVSQTLSHESMVERTVIENVIRQYGEMPAEQREALTNELQLLHAQRTAILQKLPHQVREKFAKEKNNLVQLYPDITSDKFQEGYASLCDHIIPELRQVDFLIFNFEKRHNLDASKATITPAFTMKQIDKHERIKTLQSEYAKLAKNYSSVIERIKALEENPDFINERQLLTERYKDNFDAASPEYVQHMNALRYKYVPEAKAFEEESIALGKQVLSGPERKSANKNPHQQ